MSWQSIISYYSKKYLLFAIIFGVIATGAIGGCNDNDGGQTDTQALSEIDFFNEPSLTADPEKQTVVTILEHPGSMAPESDTDVAGTDAISFKYENTIEQTICFEDEDEQAGHFIELRDSEGNQVLRVDVNGDCVTEVIEAGNYIITIHHDGRLETPHPVFIIPNPEDTEQASEADGFINVFKSAAATMLNGMQEIVTNEARAQNIEGNLMTLIATRSCTSCILTGVNLSGADLSGVDLSGAFLSGADFSGADLSEANLSGATLSSVNLLGVNLSGANLSGADLSGVSLPGLNLSGASLSGASLSFANLSGADLSGADLSGANLFGADLSAALLRNADLTGANLSGADLSGANLFGAIWTDGSCICGEPSIGTCTCAPLFEEPDMPPDNF